MTRREDCWNLVDWSTIAVSAEIWANAWQHERIAVEPRPPTREETIAHYRPRSMTVTLLRIGGIAASVPSVSMLAALTLAWVVRGFRRG